jgi:hypothetical protein
MPDSPAAEVFTFWRELLSTPRARMDERRRHLINARLCDGYSVEDLQLACLGCRASPFHMGDNDRSTRYCSIDYICRNAENIDRFVELAEREAGRLACQAAEKAARDSDVAVPMPNTVRAKIQALLGRYVRPLA